MFFLDHLHAVFTHPVDVSALALFTALAVLERVRPAREARGVAGARER